MDGDARLLVVVHTGPEVVDNRGPGIIAAKREAGDIRKSDVRRRCSATNCLCLDSVGKCIPRRAGRHCRARHQEVDKVAASSALLVCVSALGLEGYIWLGFTGTAEREETPVKAGAPAVPPPWQVPGWKNRWTFCGTGMSRCKRRSSPLCPAPSFHHRTRARRTVSRTSGQVLVCSAAAEEAVGAKVTRLVRIVRPPDRGFLAAHIELEKDSRLRKTLVQPQHPAVDLRIGAVKHNAATSLRPCRPRCMP